MKKLLAPLLGLLLAGPVLAQKASLPQHTADIACTCVQRSELPDSTLARANRCVPEAMADALRVVGREEAKIIDTVEGIKGTISKAQELLVANCPAVRDALIQQKTAQFYATSAVSAARQAYIEGEQLLREKQYKEALPLFLKAAKQDPKFVKALDNIAVCYRQTQDLKNAAHYYEKSMAIFPEGDLALLNMAVVKTLQEKNEEARAYYQKLLYFHPYNPEGYFGAGKLALLRHDFPAAMQNLFTAHRLYVEQKSPYLPDSNQLLSLLYGQMKEKNQLELFRSTAKEYNLQINE